MMIFWIILGIVAVGIALFLIAASLQPNTFRIERSATFNAPPSRIMEVLTDFHRWTEWSPWEELDPDMTRTHSGSEKGVGAKYAWEGNPKVGQGQMEIKEVVPDKKVLIDLKFIKPFKAENDAIYELEPVSGGTKLIWGMEGKNNFMGKVFSLMVNLDKMVGKDFE
jgi:uncharacterized protein YndB with AHSA1/START domain